MIAYFLATSSSTNLIASPTVEIFSARSSGIEIPNSSSISMISSTVSYESAPRSFVKLASFVTSDSETPNFSTIMLFTLDSISDIVICVLLVYGAKLE